MKKEEIVSLKIAGLLIRLTFIKTIEFANFENVFILLTKEYYKNFITKNFEQDPDYNVEIINAKSFQVLKTRNKKKVFLNFYEQISPIKIVTYYHLSTSQFQLIIRKITHDLLLRQEGFIIHASCAKIKNQAFAFLGNSGAGKSTLINLISPKLTALADDTLLIRKEGVNYYCYSSSTKEKTSWILKNINKTSLNKVFFLKKSKNHSLKLVSNKQQIIELLTAQVYSEFGDLNRHFKNITKFANNFNNFFYLSFSLEKREELIKMIITNQIS